jgi:flagellar protein FliO/FliZ
MTKSTLLPGAVAQVAAVLGACLLAFACPASAYTPSLPAPKAGGENTPLNLKGSSSSAIPHTSSGGASIVRTIVGLAIVIAVIWGLSWILRQVKAGRDPQTPSGGLASVATLPLGSGRSVHLVRAGSEYVLLGSAEHGLVPIHRYTEEEAREAGLLLVEQPTGRSRLMSSSRELITRQFTPPDATAGQAMGGQAMGGQAMGGQAMGGQAMGGQAMGGEATRGQVIVGRRPDPMRMPSPTSGLLERVRELTVRR